jgi:hypothetical protein
MIIGHSLAALNSSRTLRAVPRCETVRRRDENSRRKVQNAREDSWVVCLVERDQRTAPDPDAHPISWTPVNLSAVAEIGVEPGIDVTDEIPPYRGTRSGAPSLTAR